MTIRAVLITASLVLATSARGQNLCVEAGEISSKRQFPVDGSVVKVAGSLNAADLDYIATAVEHIETLDLSGATIAPYEGRPTGANITTAAAGTLPPYCLAGLRAERLILPATVSAICDGALIESEITEIEVPASVKEIGMAAFAECRALRSATLPAGITVIPDRLFQGCESLSGVSLGSAVTSIGPRAFYGCTALHEITIPTSLSALHAEAFAGSGLESIMLDRCEGLHAIGDRAFASALRLTNAQLPAGATDMGEGIFFGCRSLTAVSLPASATIIPALTLTGAESLEEIALPADTDSIATLAMAGMSAVTDIMLPTSLRHIGPQAFEGWTALSSIDAEGLSAVPSLGEEVWRGISPETVSLHVDERMADAFTAASQWQDFNISRSGVTGIIDNVSGSRIQASFEGLTLIVSCDTPPGGITLYDIGGRILRHIDKPAENSVRIDTSPFAGSIFIARAVTHNGMAAIFKLMRQN